MQKTFGLVGVGGYVAPRHLAAIAETGNDLLAAVDPHDSVGVLDRFFPNARFFTEIERFDRFLEKRRRTLGERPVEYVTVCSPNYLHDAHVRMALRTGAHAICEKPLAISPWNVDALAELEEETGRSVYTILQLRLLPSLQALRDAWATSTDTAEVDLTYITRRGGWYHVSWKGDSGKSGGLAMNIGIHFFDLLVWIFGECNDMELHLDRPDKMAGRLYLERARVNWFLSVDSDDLPQGPQESGHYAYRSMKVDGEEVEFSSGFENLHTECYRHILDPRLGGFGIADARPSIDLVHRVRNCRTVTARKDERHALVRM